MPASLPSPRRGLRAARGLLTAAACLAAPSCAAPGVLVASNGEHRLTAHDPDSGVTIVLTSEVWNGRPANITDEWTVLHVLVANLGRDPILLAPGDLALRDERGFRYELLDPGAVFELADTETIAAPYGRAYRRDYDPGGPVEFEPIIPPRDVAAKALPWGVLEPGTQMRGFLYFEGIESSANAATLTWHVIDPEHHPVVDMQFPLHVARPRRRG